MPERASFGNSARAAIQALHARRVCICSSSPVQAYPEWYRLATRSGRSRGRTAIWVSPPGGGSHRGRPGAAEQERGDWLGAVPAADRGSALGDAGSVRGGLRLELAGRPARGLRLRGAPGAPAAVQGDRLGQAEERQGPAQRPWRSCCVRTCYPRRGSPRQMSASPVSAESWGVRIMLRAAILLVAEQQVTSGQLLASPVTRAVAMSWERVAAPLAVEGADHRVCQRRRSASTRGRSSVLVALIWRCLARRQFRGQPVRAE